jgi:F0F1-type ATP synthase assembly protein I
MARGRLLHCARRAEVRGVLDLEAMADDPRVSPSRNAQGRNVPVRAGWTRLAGIGFELVAAVGAFVLVGYWWDRHYGTAPKGVVVGAVLGLIGGMYNLIRQSLSATRDVTAGSRTAGSERTDGEKR